MTILGIGAKIIDPPNSSSISINTELGPAVGNEIDTGFVYNGDIVYRQRFAGATLTAGDSSLIATDITGIIGIGGWCTTSDGFKRPMPLEVDIGAFIAILYINGTNLRMFVGTQPAAQPYDFYVEYIRI